MTSLCVVVGTPHGCHGYIVRFDGDGLVAGVGLTHPADPGVNGWTAAGAGILEWPTGNRGSHVRQRGSMIADSEIYPARLIVTRRILW